MLKQQNILEDETVLTKIHPPVVGQAGVMIKFILNYFELKNLNI